MKIIVVLLSIILLSCDQPSKNKLLLYPENQGVEGTVTRVIDGDTFEIIEENGNYPTKRIRLAELDAPELSTPEGWTSKYYLMSLLYKATTSIHLTYTGKDKYGRWIAYVYFEGKNINQEMIKSGHAKYVHYYNKIKY